MIFSVKKWLSVCFLELLGVSIIDVNVVIFSKASINQ